MSRQKALIADSLAPVTVDALKELGLEVTLEPGVDAKALAEAIGEHSILIVRGKKVGPEVFERGKNLALVVRAGAGVNTIDVEAASKHGVFVTNCPGQNSVAVAELTWGLILALDRRVAQASGELHAGRWNKKEYSEADGLFGKTLGVLGLGAIGREVAARAGAFGLEVIAWSRSLSETRAKELGVRRAPALLDVAKASDIVSVHLPYNKGTAGVVGREFFAALRPRAMLINAARGGIVDEAALKEAMDSRGVRYAADVFDGEPGGSVADFTNPVGRDPRVVATPHIGASTEQAQAAIAAEAVRIVRSFVREGRVLNCVNLKAPGDGGVTLSVRHFDRVGVLAGVLDAVRAANVNVQDVENVIFASGGAASARIRLASPLPETTLAEIRKQANIIAATLAG